LSLGIRGTETMLGMKEQNGICTKSIKQISLTLGTAAGSSSSFKASNDPESCPENSGNKL